MNLNNLIVFKNNEWAENSAKFINNEIISNKNSTIDLILTGGQSANKIYPYLTSYLINAYKNFNIYLSDERCVDEHDINSNYRMLKNFFHKYECLKINKFYYEDKGIDFSIQNYTKILPQKVNISLLGLGDDGHVASIFPNQTYIHNTVIETISPLNISKRLSLHLNYIQQSDKIVIIASGMNKSKIISKILKDKHCELPATKLNNAIWLIDEDAYNYVN